MHAITHRRLSLITRPTSLFIAFALVSGLSLLGHAWTAQTAHAAPPLCFGRTPTIIADGPVVHGTDGPDIIVADLDDLGITVYGRGGNDIICSEAGDDIVYGGTGNDLIHAGQGDNRVYGGGGNDSITTQNGDDLVDGQSGNDGIGTGNGNDRLLGGNGHDSLFGGGGGGDGVNVLIGGNGDDRLVDDGPGNLLFCGAGTDRASAGQLTPNNDCEIRT